jgi:hypothetical protein
LSAAEPTAAGHANPSRRRAARGAALRLGRRGPKEPHHLASQRLDIHQPPHIAHQGEGALGAAQVGGQRHERETRQLQGAAHHFFSVGELWHQFGGHERGDLNLAHASGQFGRYPG